MKNPCIDCKDCIPILTSFCLGMIIYSQDGASLFCCEDVSTLLCYFSVIDVVDCMSTSLVIDCTPSTVVCSLGQMPPKVTLFKTDILSYYLRCLTLYIDCKCQNV
jgi:hypothetical protein